MNKPHKRVSNNIKSEKLINLLTETNAIKSTTQIFNILNVKMRIY